MTAALFWHSGQPFFPAACELFMLSVGVDYLFCDKPQQAGCYGGIKTNLAPRIPLILSSPYPN